MEDSTQEINKSLAGDIVETIVTMLERPQMFATSAASLENQFWLLVVLVAPYSFGISSEEAGRKINDFTTLVTGTNSLISEKESDIETVAFYLKKCFEENFDLPTENTTIH